MEWKDATCYSRGDKERKPTTWEVQSGPLRIVVTCGHFHHRPEWVMHCFSIGLDKAALRMGLTKEQAQAEAVDMVGEKLKAFNAALAELR